jgi:hypothetical protein
LGVVFGGGFGLAAASGRLLWQGLFFSFWLCASLMPQQVIGGMLVQRLGVIGIFLILIYSLYQKNRA